MSILRDDDFINIAASRHSCSNGGHRGHRHDLQTRRKRQSLRNRCCDAHADKRTGAVTEHDGIKIWRRHACLFQYFVNHGH